MLVNPMVHFYVSFTDSCLEVLFFSTRGFLYCSKQSGLMKFCNLLSICYIPMNIHVR